MASTDVALTRTDMRASHRGKENPLHTKAEYIAQSCLLAKLTLAVARRTNHCRHLTTAGGGFKAAAY